MAFASISFSDKGNLAIVSDDSCAYIVSKDGMSISSVCGIGSMYYVSSASGMFAFTNGDYHVYITDEYGNLIKKIYVDWGYSDAVALLPDGFMACGPRGCVYFDLDGHKHWHVKAGCIIFNAPSYHQGYWYLASTSFMGYVSIIREGKYIRNLVFKETAFDTAVCNNYLAVSTKRYLYLYDISDPENPREIWNVGGFDRAFKIAFSPDCDYIAVADKNNRKLKIYDINGNLAFEKHYGDEVVAVDWWKDRIATGLEDGTVEVFTVPDNLH